MEDTQTIDWAVEEEEETEQSSESLECSLEPVGRLRVFGGAYGPEKDFPLYLGKNVVGRMPDCSVALPIPSISKQHAVIEISARNKAPVLQDCGSLNGTQILRPPKILSPGVRHPLRDHELILFADLPCQYRHLDVPQPVGSRGPLTVEETPWVPGAAQATRPPLAEDSEEEADFLSERCMEKESRATSSPLTIVPESDDEGPSPAPGGSGPSLAFNLDNDTDDKAAKSASVVRNGAPTKAKQPGGDGATHDTWLVKAPPAVGRDKDTAVRRDAGKKVVLERSHPPGEVSDTDADKDSRPARLHLERAQPSGFMDSDTDVEEEGIPATPAAVPMKKRPIFHVAGALSLAHLQESPAGRDTDVEEQKPLPAGSQTSMVINSDTDDEEEVSAALTLAQLKESGAVQWNKDLDAERARAQPMVSLEQNQTTLGRDSDTDVEEERLPVGKRESVPSAYTEKDEALVTAHSRESRPPRGDSGAGRSSHGTHLERSQASPTTVNIKTEAEEEVPPGPAVPHLESRQVSVEETNQAAKQLVPVGESRPPVKANVEGDATSAVAAVRQSKCLAKGDAHETTPEVGAHGRAPVTQREQVVHKGTPGNPTPPQRGGAPTPAERKRKSYLARTRASKESPAADCEDLDLQATQCFVESESLEGALDEPWEVLATQPFCVGEPEASAPWPMTALLEACSSHLSPRDQHPGSPAHMESLGTEGRATQTVETDRGTASETAERVTPERGTQERDMREQLAGDSADELEEKKLTRRIKDREQKQVLAGAAQGPESGRKVESVSPERSRESPKEEMETSKKAGEEDIQRETLAREALKGLIEKSVPEAGCGLAEAGLAVALEQGEMDRGHGDPEGPGGLEEQAAPASPEPGVGAGRQAGGAKGAPGSPSGQPRGPVNGKRPPAEQASGGDPQSPDACLPAVAPGASIPPSGPFTSRPLRSPLASSDPAIPRGRRSGRREAPEPALSSELDPFPTKPSVGRRASSRVATTSLSTAARVPRPPTPMEQPAPPGPMSRASQARTLRPSAKTPEAVGATAPELQASTCTSTEQPVAPEPTPRATRARTSRASARAPKAAEATAPELQPCAPTHRPRTPWATRGRARRASVGSSEPVFPMSSELQASTSTQQPVTPEPAPRVTCGRRNRSSAKTPEAVEPTAPEPQPSAWTSTEPPVTPKVTPCHTTAQGRAPQESQPSVTTGHAREPIPQARRSRRQRAAGKPGSFTPPSIHQPCSEPQNRPARHQRAGRLRAATSLGTVPDPPFPQLPEAPTQADQIPKTEPADGPRSTLEPQPGAPQRHRRPPASADSPPLLKRPQREGSPKTVVPKGEEDGSAERPGKAEDVGAPGPGKRKRDQTEKEPQEVPKRGLRRTKPAQQSTAPRVLFTGVLDTRGERALLALGGSLASSVAEASHLVTDRVCRTVKFLCALGKGIPILSLEWLHQSRKAGHFLPADQYVVTDPEQEKNFGFSLQDALTRAKERRLLEGYEIHVTPGVQPPPLQMAEIISCCGGTVLPSMPRSYKPCRVVITCPQDVPHCFPASRAGLPLLSAEFLLTGVLKQEARPEAFLL
ncbi:mediator of DNA damage checkpoint protein 1 isoform X3 [Heterocephalus glaber]|uniref:Mediator of DNA damage checkpoint protein 1 n=1 Tax=Heterocephalus glaber TaxID=10181 RepID=A0AAX6PAC2_HETGA|nr:mediator of DNA damage checkpoint protein 1 isoform X3 [Heterocephalus glaber]